jgi:hypothetical protein
LYCPSAFSVLSYLEASVDDTWQSWRSLYGCHLHY